MSEITDVSLWSEDHIYRLSFHASTQLPNPIQVTKQTAWYTDTRNRITRAMNKLCCEERVFIEVCYVKRTNRRNEQKYWVDGDKRQYRFSEAVDRIMELVAERQK